MSLEENKITVSRFYDEVFNKGNLDVVDDIFSPDYVIGDLPPDKSPSREGIKQTALMYRNAFPDLHFTIHDTIPRRIRLLFGLQLQEHTRVCFLA